MSWLGMYGGAFDWYGSLNPSNNFTQAWDEPLGLEEVKTYLKIIDVAPAESPEDTELQVLITAAREQAEIMQGRDLVRKQWDLTLDYWVEYHISLRDPLISVDLVQYKDSAGAVHPLVQGTDYLVDRSKHPGRVLPAYNRQWPSFNPWPSSSVLVRFTSGFVSTDAFWGGPGARIKNGMKLLISAWYNNRLPFERGMNAASEYPYAVTTAFSQGDLKLIR